MPGEWEQEGNREVPASLQSQRRDGVGNLPLSTDVFRTSVFIYCFLLGLLPTGISEKRMKVPGSDNPLGSLIKNFISDSSGGTLGILPFLV